MEDDWSLFLHRAMKKKWIVLKKKQYYAQILKIKCCNSLKFMYNDTCCGMIAVKREVADSQKWQSGFPWSECQVRKLTTSHCTNHLVCPGQKRRVRILRTRGCVRV